MIQYLLPQLREIYCFGNVRACAVSKDSIGLQHQSACEFLHVFGRFSLSFRIAGKSRYTTFRKVHNAGMVVFSPNRESLLCKLHSTTVILLFTNGGFATQLQAEDIEHVSGMIKNQSSRVFTYSFDKSDNLKLLASEAGGYFEILNANFDNPLYQISSYFNFMALARNASEDTPYWTKYYVNYGELDNIITVSYQVVNSKGHLIGVVAIDILLQSVLNNLPIILGDRSGIRPNNPNATLDARVGASNNICPFCEGSKVVCPRTGNMTFVDLNCCNNCNSLSAPQSPPIIPDGLAGDVVGGLKAVFDRLILCRRDQIFCVRYVSFQCSTGSAQVDTHEATTKEFMLIDVAFMKGEERRKLTLLNQQ
eukprot:Gb_23298 [translate_table: standard]